MGALIVALVTLAAVACHIHGARVKENKDWDDFLNSRWVSHRVESVVKGASRRAFFTGVEFDMSRDIDHDEKEYRVFYDGVVGMETTLKYSGETGLFHREVTDGKRLIKLVYAGDHGLVDCDVQKDRDALDSFLAQFLLMDVGTVRQMRRERTPIDVSILVGNTGLLSGNVSYRLLENRVPHEPYATLADIDSLHRQCIEQHHAVKQRLRSQGVDVDLAQEMTHEVPEAAAQDWNQPSDSEFIPRRVKRVRKATSEAHSRTRRSLLFPDTMWCGVGSSTDEYDQVGHSRGADACCRAHDGCPYYIEGLTTKYNYFNLNFHTVSHCLCDEEFRTCLRQAGTSQAEMVGEVFFDVLGAKCFEFETERVCSERSFWGSCIKYENQLAARVRGSLDWD